MLYQRTSWRSGSGHAERPPAHPAPLLWLPARLGSLDTPSPLAARQGWVRLTSVYDGSARRSVPHCVAHIPADPSGIMP